MTERIGPTELERPRADDDHHPAGEPAHGLRLIDDLLARVRDERRREAEVRVQDTRGRNCLRW
jgi:hypothetical protein